MAKGLGISGILNKESVAAATGTHTVAYLDITKIHEHQKNRQYDPKRIEALASSIEDRGLQSPIVVAETGLDSYIVISGHRRLAAYRLLAAEGKDGYAVIPSIVRAGLAEDLIEEDLITGNLFTEMPSPAELAQQLARMKELLKRRKAAGENIPGKLLDIIAEELGINSEAARRMDTINRRAIPDVQEEFAAGKLSLHEAYQAARQQPEKQQKLLAKRQAGEIEHMYEPQKRVVNLSPEQISTAGVVNLPPEPSHIVDFMTLSPISDALHGLRMAVTPDGRCCQTEDDARRIAETIQRVAGEIKALQADIWIHSTPSKD